MTTELWLLAAVGALQFVLVATHGVYLFFSAGMAWGIGRRDTPAIGSDLGRRIERTIVNNMESLAVFVPLIVTIQLAGLSNSLTQTSAEVYLAARITFALLYLGNVPYLRTVAWLTGQFCLVLLGYAIIARVV